VWTMAATMEYWILGSNSFATTSGELNFSIPANYLMGHVGPHGQFLHRFAGGVDISAAIAYWGELVSFERTLMQLFSPWLALAIHKVLIVGLSSFGVYAICQTALGCDRILSLALGAIFSQGYQAIAYYSFSHGLGYALIPLIVYVAVFRVDARYYFLRVLALALIYSSSTTPTHGFIALFNAVILAALMVPPAKYIRILGAAILIMAAICVNWYDSIIAKMVYVPFITRTAGDIQPYMPWASQSWWQWLLGRLAHSETKLLIGLCALMLLVWLRPSGWLRSGMICLFALFSGAIYQVFPWGLIGMPALSGINWSNVHFGALLINAIIFAKVVSEYPVVINSARWVPVNFDKTFFIRLVVAGACAQFVLIKFHNSLQWLGSGGINIFQTNLTRLHDVLPTDETPLRALTIPYRINANTTAAAGFDTIDGTYHIILSRVAEFWARGLPADPTTIDRTRHPIHASIRDTSGGWSIKCCEIHPIGKFFDLNLLRVVNVGYIVSALPLQDRQLRQISGPTEPISPLPENAVGFDWIKDRLILLLDPPPLYVYRIENPLPRVFAATSVVRVTPEIQVRDFYSLVSQYGRDRAVITRHPAGPVASGSEATMSVSAFRLENDRVVAQVDAPKGGTLVVNIPYTPFWTAFAGASKLKVYPVNGIQMAVTVPAGSTTVVLDYARPGIGDLVMKRRGIF
jgi:hypothetical protein